MTITSHETSSNVRAPSLHREWELRTTNPTNRGPVLLATDGTGASNAPAVAACAIAGRAARPLQVVAVLEPAPIYGGPLEMAPIPTTVDAEVLAAREATVQRYMGAVLAPGAEWKLDVRCGTPSSEVATAAREIDAGVVIVGSAPHWRRGHTVSGVRAAQVLRHVRCPVLSVAPSLTALPLRALAAIDFSAGSISAAREALTILGETGTLTLVHVAPVLHLDRPVRDASGGLFGGNGARLLEAVREKLIAYAPAGATIDTRLVAGEAAEEILVCADDLEADLIAVGTHGPNFVERLFVGSVAATLLHMAPCSVLACPPPNAAERVALELESWGTGGSADATAWGPVLDAFSSRNAGRRVRVEIDEPGLGAQVQARGYVLVGTTFDARDRRVELMLSAAASTDGHLTRTIADVDWLAVTRSSAGRDRALQVRHGSGETLLVFED
jgi:nucleotide-binding universal stress UspA family protein